MGAPPRGRELFPVLIKCAYGGCSARARADRGAVHPRGGKEHVNPMMSLAGDANALEMAALKEDMNLMVTSDSMCTRRHAMARAAGLAAGLALSSVNAPGFAAETKMVKMGSDSGQLVFVPDEIKICKGDTVTWTNNKGGPHNVVFDEDAIPSGVNAESISMDDQLGEEGETYSKKF